MKLNEYRQMRGMFTITELRELAGDLIAEQMVSVTTAVEEAGYSGADIFYRSVNVTDPDSFRGLTTIRRVLEAVGYNTTMYVQVVQPRKPDEFEAVDPDLQAHIENRRRKLAEIRRLEDRRRKSKL